MRGFFFGNFLPKMEPPKTMMEPFLKVRYSIMAWYDTSNPWRACHELHVPSRFMQKKKNIIIIISSIYFRKSFDNNGIIIWKKLKK